MENSNFNDIETNDIDFKSNSSFLSPYNIPNHLQHYWNNRYDRFSKFDEGIQVDVDGLFETTIEEIARHVSKRISDSLKFSNQRNITVFDAFCGPGSSMINFALNPLIGRVISVDISPEKIKMAKNNASVYNIKMSKVELIVGNTINLIQNNSFQRNNRIDVCFLSPPWGGSSYKKKRNFSLERDIILRSNNSGNTVNGVELFNLVSSKLTKNICYNLPLNFDMNELKKLNYSGTIEVETNYFNSFPKTKSVYFGNLVKK